MFGREEKGEERKGWREKGEENGEVCVWYGEKNGRKGKMRGNIFGWDPPILILQKWEEMERKEGIKILLIKITNFSIFFNM